VQSRPSEGNGPQRNTYCTQVTPHRHLCMCLAIDWLRGRTGENGSNSLTFQLFGFEFRPRVTGVTLSISLRSIVRHTRRHSSFHFGRNSDYSRRLKSPPDIVAFCWTNIIAELYTTLNLTVCFSADSDGRKVRSQGSFHSPFPQLLLPFFT
jgi:hypothetical protein